MGVFSRGGSGGLGAGGGPGGLLVLHHRSRLDLLISWSWIISNLALSTHHNVISLSFTSITPLPFTSSHSTSCSSAHVRVGNSHVGADPMMVTLFTTYSSSLVTIFSRLLPAHTVTVSTITLFLQYSCLLPSLL